MSLAQTSASAHSVKQRCPRPAARMNSSASTGSPTIERRRSASRGAPRDDRRRRTPRRSAPSAKKPGPAPIGAAPSIASGTDQRDTARAACAARRAPTRSAHSAIINSAERRRTSSQNSEPAEPRARASATAIIADADRRARASSDGASAPVRRSQAPEAPLRAGRTRRPPRPSVVAVEIGPERVDEQQFGIGRLPQQEVRQPLLARGADQQVERRQVGVSSSRLDRRRRRSLGGSSSPSRACSRQRRAARGQSRPARRN